MIEVLKLHNYYNQKTKAESQRIFLLVDGYALEYGIAKDAPKKEVARVLHEIAERLENCDV
jgi:hypothetical protein